MKIIKSKGLGIIILMIIFVLSITACEMNDINDIVNGIDDELPIEYTDDYLGLQVGLEMESALGIEAVLYNEENEEIATYSLGFSSKSVVKSKDYDNGTAEFVVQALENEEAIGGSIFEREEEENYFLTGIIDEEQNEQRFEERIEVLRGKIEKGDTITIPVELFFDEFNGELFEEFDNEELIIDSINLEAVEFEKVAVPAGEFVAWKLVEEMELLIEDYGIEVILEIKTWFVPYLGVVKTATEIKVDFLEPFLASDLDEEEKIDRAVIEIGSELVSYSK